MTKRRKKSLTRQILLGMLAAGVLWGGFAAQAEAIEQIYYLNPATNEKREAACNNTVTAKRNMYSPRFRGEEYAVGYVGENIAANANGNTLTLNTGVNFHKVSADGGPYYFSIYGGKVYLTSLGEANYNTVIVNGGNYEINDLAGGYGPTASHNTVTINNTKDTFIATAIMGGGGTGNSDYNTVNINGGKFAVKSIAGGGFSGNSHNNTVNINGGTFSENIKIYGGSTTGGTVSGNTVNITGGTFCKSADIIGGHSLIRTTNNNTVTISGGIFKSGIYLCGGDNAGTNNTLNLKMKGLYAFKVDGFQNLNFYIPNTIIPNTAQANETMLTVNEPFKCHNKSRCSGRKHIKDRRYDYFDKCK